MNDFVTMLSGEFFANLVTALLHTLWQGVLIGGVLYLYLNSGGNRSANIRYVGGVVGLGAIVVCGLFTWAILNYEPVGSAITIGYEQGLEKLRPVNAEFVNEGVKVVEVKSSAAVNSASKSLNFNLHLWLLGLWAVGVFVMLCRAVWLVIGVGRFRRQCVLLDDEKTLGIVDELRVSMRISRRIKVFVSEHICMPGVIGFIRPALLLPVSMVTGICTDDLEAILSHELAHIRRYDFLVNFCQMIIEAVLFFNPAVWWISRQIRVEREACCDVAGVSVTGKRIEYANVLAEWAGKLNLVGSEKLSPVIAGFGKGDKGGGMVDRVKRLLVTGHRPRARVSWYAMILMLVGSIVILVCLWSGMKFTVAFAAKVLSPQERIEKMAEIAKTHGGEYREYQENERITLAGKVTTYDGKALPGRTNIIIEAYGYRHSGSTHIDIRSDGIFRHSVGCNKNVFVAVNVPGYATGFSEIYQPEPNDVIDDIEIVLVSGFTAEIEVVDEAGMAIAGAKLNKSYFIEQGGGWGSLGHLEVVSDYTGIATFEHCLERPVKMDVKADGYQAIEDGDYTFRKGEKTVITLKKGLVASGVVVAKETGEPITGAKFKLVYKERPGHGWGMGLHHNNYEAVTDESGKFVLNTLAEEFKYTFVVEADGFNYFALPDVEVGDKDLKIEMLGELYIKGKVVGDLTKLSKSYVSELRKSVPSLHYDSRFTDHEYDHLYYNDYIAVDISDGVGYFTLKNILGDKVTFRGMGTGKRVTVKIEDESVDDVVIDLDATKNLLNMPTREVILKFQSPEGYPAVGGKVRVWYMTKEVSESEQRSWSGLDVVIEKGVGKVDFPVPAYIRLADTEDINPGFPK